MFRWLTRLWRSLNAPQPLPDTLRREYYESARKAALEYRAKARKQDPMVGQDQHVMERRALLEMVKRQPPRFEDMH